MNVAQLGEDGATGRSLFGSYTLLVAPAAGGFMLFKVLASAPVSIALLKMRRTRITALACTRAVFMQISWAPRAWEDPSTLPSIAKEAPPEPVKVATRNPSTRNSEEDILEEDGSSQTNKRHEEKEKKHEKHDRRQKHHPHDPDIKRKRQKDKEKRRHKFDSN